MDATPGSVWAVATARAMPSAWLSVRPRPVGSLERGLAQCDGQLGLIAVAQRRIEGRDRPPGLLVSLVGDAVQGSGDGGVAVCAHSEGEAKQRGVDVRLDPGDPRCVQAGGEMPAGAAGIGG